MWLRLRNRFLWLPAWAWAGVFIVALMLSANLSQVAWNSRGAQILQTEVFRADNGTYTFIPASLRDQPGLAHLWLKETTGWGPNNLIGLPFSMRPMFATVGYDINLILSQPLDKPLSVGEYASLLDGYKNYLRQVTPDVPWMLPTDRVATLSFQLNPTMTSFRGPSGSQLIAWRSETVRSWRLKAAIGAIATLLLLPAAAMTVVLVLLPSRREIASLRRKRGICPVCRYDLKFQFDKVCPECGKDPKADC